MTSFEETEQSLLELQQLLLFTFQPRPDDVAPVDDAACMGWGLADALWADDDESPS